LTFFAFYVIIGVRKKGENVMSKIGIFAEKNPGKFLLIGIVLCYSLLYATSSVATIEVIDGQEYVVAIDGKDIDPRKPNRYDIEMIWEYNEAK
jgi:hypothetical protein